MNDRELLRSIFFEPSQQAQEQTNYDEAEQEESQKLKQEIMKSIYIYEAAE